MNTLSCLTALLTCFSLSALAQDMSNASSQWLPPADKVRLAIQAQPSVRAALERVNAAVATQDALIVGSHEFQLNSGVQRRKVPAEQRNYHEWELGISRAIRLPAKARLDSEIGKNTHDLADLRRLDAEQQMARTLLDAWMNWLGSNAIAEEAAAQEQLLTREQATLARRLALGDAAQREMDMLNAELATQTAQTLMARAAEQVARQNLSAVFPQIELPSKRPELPEPQALTDSAQAWQTRLVEESATLAIARIETTRFARLAERARAERKPDPTVGVRVMSDRAGQERTVGVVLSIPFGTDYRSAVARAEAATAAAAELEAASVQRNVEQAAWQAVQAAQSKRAQWQSFQQAWRAQVAASKRTGRAWELGEAPLSEYLLSLRSLAQAQLIATQARVDALQAMMRVFIDAQIMWSPEHTPGPADTNTAQ